MVIALSPGYVSELQKFMPTPSRGCERQRQRVREGKGGQRESQVLGLRQKVVVSVSGGDFEKSHSPSTRTMVLRNAL